MRKLTALVAVGLLCGCSHFNERLAINALFTAAVIAAEVAAADCPPPEPLCAGDHGFLHPCPDTQPPPPPDN